MSFENEFISYYKVVGMSNFFGWVTLRILKEMVPGFHNGEGEKLI